MSDRVNGNGRGGKQPTGNNGGRGRGGYNKYSRGALGASTTGSRRKQTGVMKEFNQQKQKEKDTEASELEKTTKLNSEVCARMDKKFEKLIKVSAQVALYEYDCSSAAWKPCNTRGSLFLYKRVVEPHIGLFILNRNSLENFTLLVTPQIEMQIVKPNIMMKTTEAIRCLWFYSEEDCMEIANLISKKVGISMEAEGQVVKKESAVKPDSKTKSQSSGAAVASVPSGNEGRHILSLLCNNVLPIPIQNAVQEEEQDKNCQNRRPGQKGLTQQELDSLGAELRATLGIINDPLMLNDPLMMLNRDKSEDKQVTEKSTFLNMEQMLQATLYLLKTEKGFAGKLEAAYFNSLGDS